MAATCHSVQRRSSRSKCSTRFVGHVPQVPVERWTDEMLPGRYLPSLINVINSVLLMNNQYGVPIVATT